MCDLLTRNLPELSSLKALRTTYHGVSSSRSAISTRSFGYSQQVAPPTQDMWPYTSGRGRQSEPAVYRPSCQWPRSAPQSLPPRKPPRSLLLASSSAEPGACGSSIEEPEAYPPHTSQAAAYRSLMKRCENRYQHETRRAYQPRRMPALLGRETTRKPCMKC